MTMQPFRALARTLALAALALGAAAGTVHAHGDVMRIGSSQPGGGQLRIEPGFDFDLDVVLSPEATLGDLTLYKSIFPSFTWVLQSADGIHPLSAQVAVRLTLVAPLSAATVRVDARLLDTANETATIGTFDPDPESHVHPEWQLILSNGVTGQYPIHFMLTTTAAGYTQSPVYSLTLTNVAAATATPTATIAFTATPSTTATPSPSPSATATLLPSASQTPTHSASLTPTAPATATPDADTTATPTTEPPPTSSMAPDLTATPTTTRTDTAEPTATSAPTTATLAITATATEAVAPTATETPVGDPTATTTPSPAACAGDCNGDGSVTINELIRAVGLAGGSGAEGCAAADGNRDGTIAIDELVRAVRSALDGCGGGAS